MSHSGFCFRVPDVLESDKVKLVPFNINKHATYMCVTPASVFNYLPTGPYETADDFVATFWESIAIPNKGAFTTFAIFDKTRSEFEDAKSFAGMASYMNASAIDLCVEIGFIVILPAFQRTHVTTHMVGLLGQYALNVPEDGGLALRRLVWQCSSTNAPSVAAAKRMGFQYEGTLRWARVLKADKGPGGNGREVREGDPKKEQPGRDTTILSICFDDWETGKKEFFKEMMARKV
ncbi:acyl-CoA N-acyltransferase [Mucidula mucida]|nr:acyl-CoA N-acyltransferase [Mucidula mucida]